MRKEKTVTITDDGRDQGRQYLITEMPASRAEKWAMRALLALGRSGVDIGEAQGLGMQGIAILGVRALAKLHFEDAEPLLDEMLQCVAFLPDASNHNVKRPLVENDIEEITTRLKLRQEVIELHIGFFSSGKSSIFPSSMTSTQKESTSSSIEMSPLAHGAPLSQRTELQ